MSPGELQLLHRFSPSRGGLRSVSAPRAALEFADFQPRLQDPVCLRKATRLNGIKAVILEPRAAHEPLNTLGRAGAQIRAAV